MRKAKLLVKPACPAVPYLLRLLLLVSSADRLIIQICLYYALCALCGRSALLYAELACV